MENSLKNESKLEGATQTILDVLYRELGYVDFIYIETSQYLDELQIKRENLIRQIKQEHGTNQNLHSGS